MITLRAALARNATAERIRKPLGEPVEQRTARHRRSAVTAT